MTDKVNPSINRPAEAFKTAGSIALAGGASSGYITDSPSQLSVQDGGITEANLNAFAETSGGASLDVTIDGGEAFIYGSWLAIDTSTTVSLSASTAGQTVYVGWNKDGTDDVIIGLASAFDNASGNTDEKIPLYDFDTDASGVISVTDRRTIGKTLDGRVLNNTASVSSNYTTNGEQLIFADTSGGALTVTLSTADLDEGSNVIVVDSGGAAKANVITVDTEGTASIDGATSTVIENEYGAKAIASDGSNWYTSGSGGSGGVVVEDNGTISVDPATAINFATDLSVTDDGDGTVTVDSTVDPTIEVQDDGTSISTSINNIDFGGSDFTVTNPTAGEAEVALTNDNVTVSAGTGVSGGGTVALGGSITLNVSPSDDEEITFGTSDDFSLRYDSANDDIRWQDNTNSTDRMALDRTSGNLTISGQLTEGSTL